MLVGGIQLWISVTTEKNIRPRTVTTLNSLCGTSRTLIGVIQRLAKCFQTPDTRRDIDTERLQFAGLSVIVIKEHRA